MVKGIAEQFKEVSAGILRNTTDFVLFMLAFGIGLGVSGYSTRGVHRAADWAEGIDLDTVRRALDHLKSKGWIKRDLHVTREGQKRLTTFIPEPRKYPKRWSGIWYLVSFDIPERIAWKRDNFRISLRSMGFGKLHESLWISPYNFLGDAQAYCKAERLTEYVLPAISEEVGTRASKELADRIWRLEGLNNEYAKWIEGYIEGYKEGNADPEKQFRLILTYSTLLRRDPFLPRPLLPSSWFGERAHKLFQKLAPLTIVDASRKK